MQNTIKIDSGDLRIAITDRDEKVKGEITFNPNDTLFIQRLYVLQRDIKGKLEQFENENSQLLNEHTDENFEKRFSLINDINNFIRERIDNTFGSGTSQIVFGDVVSYDFDIYLQFIDGVIPFIQPVRAHKVNKHISPVKKPSKGAGPKRK